MKTPAHNLSTDVLSRSARFRRMLLDWDQRENRRFMPWKGEKDPYRIWLSEIILQQTRVEQGTSYYQKFIKAYPSIRELAAASDDKVFRLWEGLGYYSRCRNLLATARLVVSDHGGQFPSDHSQILALKGIGPYTAAAISSFAFGQKHAVLDGNVYRVISRIHAIETPSDSTGGKQLFAAVAEKMVSSTEPARYNQAIMDFGATICRPVPICHQCFFRKSCQAYALEKQLLFPVRSKTIIRKERWLNYIIVKNGDAYAIRKRQAGDIWNNLYEFLLLETPSKPSKAIVDEFIKVNMGESKFVGSVKEHRQHLTHQTIYFRFLQILIPSKNLPKEFIWVSKADLAKYPFPKSLREYISSELI